MSMKKRITAAFLAVSLALCACGKEEKTPAPAVDDRGSAKVLDGKTVIVSIFADDYLSSWDFENPDDIALRETVLENLGYATDYISGNSRKWGKNAEFVYDWTENTDLSCQRSVPLEASNFEFKTSHYFSKIVDITIDETALLEKYEAENILYIYFFNTDFTHEAGAQAFPYFGGSQTVYYHETLGIPLKRDSQNVSATVYAHEILHLFGAPDYYKGNSVFGVSDEYIEYCSENHPNELMRTTRGEDGKYIHGEITAEINEITAYYIGWTDYSQEVEDFGLTKSTHDKKTEE